MTKFPDCMMPDGAEPCLGYQELQAEVERLRALWHEGNEALRAEVARLKMQAEAERSRARYLNTRMGKAEAEVARLKEIEIKYDQLISGAFV